MRYALKEINQCPVCNSVQRKDFDGMSTRKTAGYHYLKPAAELLNRTVEDLVEEIKVYQCTNCLNFYCNPWLNSELSSHVFCVGAPDHIAGWGNLEQWISSVNPNAVEKRNNLIFKLVLDKLGPIYNYAEFGCPFQGFLMTMKSWDLPTRQERLDKFSYALKQQNDPRWTKYAKIYNILEGIAKKIIVWTFVLRSLKKDQLDVKTRNYAHQAPLNRKFLTEDTNIGWGVNCVRYGSSCRYFANRLMDVDVLPLSEFERNFSYKFDLIGIFNFLDHITAPLEMIKRCLGASSNLLIITHRASHAGRQHLWAFSDRFPEWIRENFSYAEVYDLSIGQDLPKDYQYILITQKA